MSTLTTKFKLTKAEESDAADFTAINQNWDIIDEQLSKVNDQLDEVDESIKALQALQERVEALEWIDLILVEANSSDAWGTVYVNSVAYPFDGEEGDEQFIAKKYKKITDLRIQHDNSNHDMTIVIVADGVEVLNSNVPVDAITDYTNYIASAKTGSVIIRY